MYALIQTGGKQYRVTPGELVKVDKLPGQSGDSIVFEKVLLTADDDNVTLGNPYLENTRVLGQITRQGRDRKVVVFKYKRRKGYRKIRGHRQDFTLVRVEGIEK